MRIRLFPQKRGRVHNSIKMLTREILTRTKEGKLPYRILIEGNKVEEVKDKIRCFMTPEEVASFDHNLLERLIVIDQGYQFDPVRKLEEKL